VTPEKGISAHEEDREELPKPAGENPTTTNQDGETTPWSKREDKALVKAAKAFHGAGFLRISKEIEGRSKSECQTRYFLLKEIRKQKKLWASNEVNVLQPALLEKPDTLDNQESLSKKLPDMSSSNIKEKLPQTMKLSNRK